MRSLYVAVILLCSFSYVQAQKPPITVTAYYAGNAQQLDNYDPKQLTHIIYSFCHLRGNKLRVDSKADSVTIKRMISMKKKNPALKVLLSLGGWGGCETCSDVFSSENNRKAFANSVKDLNTYFGTDGIDLDWEYPTIQGYPGHRFVPEDRNNFTELVKELRNTLGNDKEVTFAAGAFPKFLENAVDWKEVMKYCDRVNLMTYDLINGYDSVTGHHTALYSTPSQLFSTDYAVTYLTSIGIDPGKLVIGAAFYARVWENVADINNGLHQRGKFKSYVGYRSYPTTFSKANGFAFYWDSTAKAPYMYSVQKKQFATFDDKESLREKTRYVLEKNLNGIMFWQLSHDSSRNGLVEAIDATILNWKNQ